MSEQELQAWTEAADAHALGEGPHPGPAPDMAGALESEFFEGLSAMGEAVDTPGDAALADALVDRFSAGQASAASPTAASSSGGLKIAAAVAATGAALAWFLLRPPPSSPEPVEATQLVAPAVESRSPETAEPEPQVAPPPASTRRVEATEAPVQAPIAEQAPVAEEVPPRHTAKPPAPRLSAAELLARARARKGKGDRKGAERSYRQLVKTYPNSPEAHASHVSLGQLQLGLGKSRSALEQFERYTKKGGPLLEEALWGRVQSLHRLGRGAKRDAAIDELERRFPASAYRARARKLQGGQP